MDGLYVVGIFDGRRLGIGVDGIKEGEYVGENDAIIDGAKERSCVGELDGSDVGIFDGPWLGFEVDGVKEGE